MAGQVTGPGRERTTIFLQDEHGIILTPNNLLLYPFISVSLHPLSKMLLEVGGDSQRTSAGQCADCGALGPK